jgi:hypothetical protein
MTDPKQPVVTAEARALLAEFGFVEVIDDSGRISFMARDLHEERLAAGKLVGVRAVS